MTDKAQQEAIQKGKWVIRKNVFAHHAIGIVKDIINGRAEVEWMPMDNSRKNPALITRINIKSLKRIK